jgi:hypothetical protein
MRRSNKEPEWSSICNNVFDEYLDDDDLFGLEANQRDRSSSNDSVNLFDFSGSSEQSHQTEATSPIPSWEPPVKEPAVEQRQPKPKEPVTFWTKTLRALEQNAAECERKQQTLRSTKSHPDFLSLGGCPSPPMVPLSPTDQSFSAQRRVSRSAANGKRRNITARSVSRGRPSGVTKTVTAGSTNPYATVRKCSASPPKMMTPSRYRAGFKDVWAEKLQSSPSKYALRVPSSAFPESPPPSARVQPEDDYAAFGSPTIYPPLPAFDEQMSPLATTFQQAHIHTPLLSPTLNAAARSNNAYISSLALGPPIPYQSQELPVTDAAPLYPERTSSLAANKIQTFDFGFSSSPLVDTWSVGPGQHGNYTTAANQVPFLPLQPGVMPSIETTGPAVAGLGISCDPTLVSNFPPAVPTAVPAAIMLPRDPTATTYSNPVHPHGLPTTPHRRARTRARSQSPSPPITEPREPRSSKRATSSRRASRHRRAKSTNATPRQAHGLDRGGFVNFTPQDSTKILSGVAPSGSSKTKARREKEAAEKRRRFSQAAVRAVVEAGGDLETLDKAGLLV